MFGWEVGCAGFWWIFPLVFMLICFFMMRGCGCMSGWHRDGRSGGNNSNESAEDILRKRYAQGEIDLERFEEMKKNITEK